MGKTVQSLEERVQTLKEAVRYEISDVARLTLARLYPDRNLSLSGLKKEIFPGREVTKYTDPVTGALIATLRVKPAHSLQIDVPPESWHTEKKTTKKTTQIPHKELLFLHSPEGNIDTRINIGYAELPSGCEEKIRVIQSITEYYPPTQKRSIKDDELKNRELKNKQRSKNLKIFRNLKARFGSAVPPNGNETPSHKKGGADEEQETRILKHEHGKVKREKDYKVRGITGRYSGEEEKLPPVSVESLSLAARLCKDRINHPDRNYQVTQYAGGKGFNTAHYDINGKLVEQSTYNSDGELKKILDTARKEAAKKSHSIPFPSSVASASRVRTRDALKALFEEKLEWLGRHIDVSAKLGEMSENGEIASSSFELQNTPD